MAAARKRRPPVKQTERVLKEYRCLAHGDFEAYKDECPRGCDTVERVFRTPQSIGGQSKNIDRTLDTLASDFKMTDMRNDLGSVMASVRGGQMDARPVWGNLPTVRDGDPGNAVASAIGGAQLSESVARTPGGGLKVVYPNQHTAYDLQTPKPVPLSPKHIDLTDIRTVKPA